MGEYERWMLTRKRERMFASSNHIRACRLLGIAQRKYPFSSRAQFLQAIVAKYYREIEEEM